MNLKAEQLDEHLSSQGLSETYIISGDESVLVQDCADTIRRQAAANGYSERKVFNVDSKFDWNTILFEVDNMSLFSEKKFMEIRIISGKPGEKGSKIIQEYLQKIPKKTLTLFISPKLDRSTNKSKWFTAITKAGISVQIWPIASIQLPHWLKNQLDRYGIAVSDKALRVLTDKVEGNLLAATQEIEKLKLLGPEGEISAEAMSSLIIDNAKFNVFILLDEMMEGNAKKSCRILQGLRDEGTDITIILWAITRDIRILIKATEAISAKKNVDSLLQKLGVWDKRNSLIKKTISRISMRQLEQMLRLAGGIDRAIKGLRQGAPWDELTTLVLALCGVRSVNAKNLRISLQ
ncbi:MAG: DNA polymerase III subunit delta [Porticoccus sp.]